MIAIKRLVLHAGVPLTGTSPIERSLLRRRPQLGPRPTGDGYVTDEATRRPGTEPAGGAVAAVT